MDRVDQHRHLRFDGTIQTDGHSVTFQLTDPGRKKRNGNAATAAKSKRHAEEATKAAEEAAEADEALAEAGGARERA